MGQLGTGGDGWTYGKSYIHSVSANVWIPINPVGSGPTKNGALNQELCRNTRSFSLAANGRPVFESVGVMYAYAAGNGILMEAVRRWAVDDQSYGWTATRWLTQTPRWVKP